MRIFVTGATGFIGSAVVAELLGHGHSVLGPARNDASAAKVQLKAARFIAGNSPTPEFLVAGAEGCDGVAHLAFIHDFSSFKRTSKSTGGPPPP